MSVSKDFTETQLDWEVRGQSEDQRNTVRKDRAKTKGAELDLIRARLATSTTAHISRAADQVVAAGSGAMSQESWNDFTRKVQLVARAAELDSRLADLQENYAGHGPRVTAEQRVCMTPILRIRTLWIG